MNDENKLMGGEECKREFIRKVEIDMERIESIKGKALQRLKRAEATSVSLETVSFIVEDYYEVIKELFVAYMLKNGLRSKNHQCLISYFYKNNPENEREAFLIAEMSFFRNRLDYYGEDIPMSFYEKNKEEFRRIIELVLKLINNNS